MSMTWNVLNPLGERYRQLGSGVDIPEQDVCDSVSSSVTQIPGMQDGLDARCPRHRDGGALRES